MSEILYFTQMFVASHSFFYLAKKGIRWLNSRQGCWTYPNNAGWAPGDVPNQELQAVGFRIDNMMRDARLTALTQAPMEVEPKAIGVL